MKTKIGISAGAYAAFTFLMALWGGWIPLTIAVGFVLIFESNEWLRATVVKAVALLVCFSLLTVFLNIIPHLFSLINSAIRIFNGEGISTTKLDQIISFLSNIIGILERVFFLLLALFALKMKTIRIGFIDNFVQKHLTLGR